MLPAWTIKWLVSSVAFWLAAMLIPGFRVKGFGGAIVGAAVFGLLSWLLGSVLVFAIGVLTLGIGFLLDFLTRWVVNAILLKTAGALTDRINVKSFGVAFVAGLVISLLTAVGTRLFLGSPLPSKGIWI